MAPKPDLYAVVEPFIGVLADGTPCDGLLGELFAADHPAVSRWPHHFRPSAPAVRQRPGTVEQATAAPGEKRGA